MNGLFSVDAETNGLHGDVWAIGAVYVANGQRSTFHSRIPTHLVTDPWVIENVVPQCMDIPEVPVRHLLLERFWEFWMEHNEDRNVTAIANFGTPVEAGLFRACIQRDIETRNFQGPFPLHELATAYHVLGIDPNEVDTFEFCGVPDLNPHNPLDDSIAAAAAWMKLLGIGVY